MTIRDRVKLSKILLQGCSLKTLRFPDKRMWRKLPDMDMWERRGDSFYVITREMLKNAKAKEE